MGYAFSRKRLLGTVFPGLAAAWVVADGEQNSQLLLSHQKAAIQGVWTTFPEVPASPNAGVEYTFNPGEPGRQIKRFVDDAYLARDPLLYLRLLSPYHKQWHESGMFADPTALFTFHRPVVRGFYALGLDRVLDVERFRDPSPELEALGRPFEPELAINSANRLLGHLSHIASWHSGNMGWAGAHSELEQFVTVVPRDRVDLINPAINIYLPQFWQLHTYINDGFEALLPRMHSFPGCDAVPPNPDAAADFLERGGLGEFDRAKFRKEFSAHLQA